MTLNAQPFLVGDKVTLNGYYHNKKDYLNNVIRNVVQVKRSGCSRSGWVIYVDGPNYHEKGEGLAMDAEWFVRVVESDRHKHIDNIIRKIIAGINDGKDDFQIDKDFQRHVTKADLIGSVRFLLAKNGELPNGQA